MALAKLSRFRTAVPYVLGLGISLFSPSSNTYEPGRVKNGEIEYNTHSLLTKKTVEQWNERNPEQKLDADQVVIGTIQEDSEEALFIRSYNHFCDFQDKQQGVLGFPCSKAWAQSPEVQSGKIPIENFKAHAPLWGEVLYLLYSYIADDFEGGYPYSDQTWQRAIREQNQNALGHILHLIQDLTVPAHSRNDIHPPIEELLLRPSVPTINSWKAHPTDFHSDSYEVWAGSNPEEKVKALDVSTFVSPHYPSLDEIFDALNGFSGSNFFSDDTITKYPAPKISTLTERKVDCAVGLLKGKCSYYFGIVDSQEVPMLRKGILFNLRDMPV